MRPSPRYTLQLAEFLAAVSSAESEGSAARAAVERAAETLDAEVAAIVRDGELVAAVGYPDGAAPVAELAAVGPGETDCTIAVPGVGRCPATGVSLEHPPGAIFVVARSGSRGLSPEEAGLLRGMAGVTSLTMRMLHLLDDERAAREELAASRARILETADGTRRRIERDLHDGIQQRLVTLGLELRGVRDAVAPEQRELLGRLSHVQEGLNEVFDDVLELARGVHPAILSQGGLGPALKSLALRSALPVELAVHTESRYPPAVEVAAYYVVSEALTNTIKYAGALAVDVVVEQQDWTLQVCVRDDGCGGADPRRGSGLIGLRDRVEALGGSIEVTSPVGHGTTIQVSLPIERPVP